MKKIGFLLCLSLILSGCNNSKREFEEQRQKYENYMELIIDNSKQITTNVPFNWEFNMTESEGKYIYEVIISKPLVEMSDIQMIAVDIEQISESEIAPNLGLFEEERYNMIPNQICVEKGYYPGIGVNGVSNSDKFILNCLVVYKDRKQSDNYVYFIINADYDDFKVKEVTNDENKEVTKDEGKQ